MSSDNEKVSKEELENSINVTLNKLFNYCELISKKSTISTIQKEYILCVC